MEWVGIEWNAAWNQCVRVNASFEGRGIFEVHSPKILPPWSLFSAIDAEI